MTPYAEEIFISRYAIDEKETWEQCSQRMEEKSGVKEIGGYVFDMYFLPGGRILRNLGRIAGSLHNCYHLPIGDSISEIGQFLKDSLSLWSEGGGVGCNFSRLRPKGSPILGKGGVSSGLTSFLTASDACAETIESGGSRRAAALASVDISHPEIYDFINSKLVEHKLSHYNLSVNITEEFLEAVENKSTFDLKFNSIVHKTVEARDLWNLILNNMLSKAEPGLINMTNLARNNSYYFAPILGTNPCGEVPLEAYGVCCLGSLVLPNFLTPTGKTNWKKMGEVIEVGVEFLDRMIDLNKYVLPEIEKTAHRGRRIGLGVMGLAEYLFGKEVRYGSEEAVEEINKVFKFIRDTAYVSSIKLSQSKGSFPSYQMGAYSKSHFIRGLPPHIRADIKRYGTRNCTCLAVAPTGTISLLPEVSGGCEPLFAKTYERKDRVSTRVYSHPLLEKFSSKKHPDWFVDTSGLNPEDHLAVQAAVQKYVDGSVSKTINCPENMTIDKLDKVLLEYLYDLKGVTIYRDGSKEGQVLTPECPTGKCEV